jgi:hypothetical protein
MPLSRRYYSLVLMLTTAFLLYTLRNHTDLVSRTKPLFAVQTKNTRLEERTSFLRVDRSVNGFG